MYLQLADNGQPAYLGAGHMSQGADLLEYMVAIPNSDGGISWVREDMLDDVPDEILYQILESQPHMAGIRDWFGRMKERRQERKTERQNRRIQNKAAKFDERQRRRDIKGGGIIERIGQAAQGVIGQTQWAKDAPMAPPARGAEDFFPQITGSANIGVAQWWQNPAVLIGGAVVVLGGIYLLTKKKR